MEKSPHQWLRRLRHPAAAMAQGRLLCTQQSSSVKMGSSLRIRLTSQRIHVLTERGIHGKHIGTTQGLEQEM